MLASVARLALPTRRLLNLGFKSQNAWRVGRKMVGMVGIGLGMYASWSLHMAI